MSKVLRRLEFVEQELEAARERRDRMAVEVRELEEEVRHIKSLRWIEANEVKREDIHDPDSEHDMPWFGHVDNFLSYIRSLKPELRKQFVAWNGVINFTEMALNSGFNCRSPGRMSEVKTQ